MKKKVNVALSMDFDSLNTLIQNKELESYAGFNTIPVSFEKIVRIYMRDNVGYETGPIYCLAKLNGDNVKLDDSSVNGYQIFDILPSGPGDVLLLFSVDRDLLVSMSLDQLFILKSHALKYGEDNEVVLESFNSSLEVGVYSGDENVIGFLPKISLEDCIECRVIDSSWKTEYKNVFSGIPGIKVTELSVF